MTQRQQPSDVLIKTIIKSSIQHLHPLSNMSNIGRQLLPRVCLKVLGPGFVIGMTIDVEPDFPIFTVGDLLTSLHQQPELAAICQQFGNGIAPTAGELFFRDVHLTNRNARLLEDVVVNDFVTLTQGGVETLEYRMGTTTSPTTTPAAANPDSSSPLGDDFQAAMSLVFAGQQDDPIPTLDGLLKVLGNIAKDPSNPKFQKIKRQNPKFQQLVGSHPGAIQVLLSCGFRDNIRLQDEKDGAEHLYLQFQSPATSSTWSSSSENDNDSTNIHKLKAAVTTLRRMKTELEEAASLLLIQGNNPLAVVPIHSAQKSWQMYRNILGPRHVLVAKSINACATMLYAQGQDANALKLCREAKDVVEGLGGPRHSELAPILANLAYMLSRSEQTRPEAEQLIERALSIMHSLPSSASPPDYRLSVLNVSAGVQMSLSNCDSAIGQWEQVLEGMQESDKGYFVIVGNIARARVVSGDFSRAERDYQAAVRICEQQEAGGEHLQLAGILANLGTVQKDHLGKVQEAEQNLERAWQIRESRLSFGNHLTLQVFQPLCDVLEQSKNYVKLSALLRRCSDYTQQRLGLQHPDTAKSLTNMALILLRFQNNAREAIPPLRQAVSLYQGLPPGHAEALLMATIHLGSALRYEKPEEAESILLEAVSTAEFRNDPRSMGPALSALGALDVDKDDHEMALARLERGLQLNIQHHGNDMWYTELNRRELAKVYLSTGRRQKARNLYRVCLAYFEQKLLPTDERLVMLRQEMDELSSG